MKCKNCGSALNVVQIEPILRCDYCGTYSPNSLGFQLTSAQNESYGDYEILELNEDFIKLKEKSNDELKKDARNWIAYLYNGISEFWLGTNDFKHLRTALSNFDKAYQISNDDRIILKKSAFIFSAVSLASSNKIYGEDLTNAINVFEFAKSQNITLPSAIAIQQKEFCTRALDKLLQSAEQELNLKKKDFDITYINLQNIFKLSNFSGSISGLERFYLYTKLHLQKHKTKSYIPELSTMLTFAEQELTKKGSNIIGKSISFNLFGKLKIE